MKSRIIKIMFSRCLMRDGNLSTKSMLFILENLPENAKVFGFAEEQNRDCASLLIGHNTFPEVSVGSCIPEVIYTYNGDAATHSFESWDFDDEFLAETFSKFQREEKVLRFASTPTQATHSAPTGFFEDLDKYSDLFSEYNNTLSILGDRARMGAGKSELDFYRRRLLRIETLYAAQITDNVPQRLDDVEKFSEYKILGDPQFEKEFTAEFIKNNPNVFIAGSPKNKECAHSYISYVGLTETYDYCEHCQEKKT